MPCNVNVGDQFPDFELSDMNNKKVRLSNKTKPSEMDRRLQFLDGYPIIIMFYRGYFCPRDQQQMRMLVEFQSELKVNYCQMISISVEEPTVQAAFRSGLNASWSFVSDADRALIKQLDILDETEGEYAYRALPYTFVLKPNLEIYKIYNGWFFIGRPTLEELRQDLRSIMETMSYYSYEAYNTDHVKQLRIPQQAWAGGAPPLGSNGMEVREGIVNWFNYNSGNGMIKSGDKEVFFNFTAIPGEGYRTLKAGAEIKFELVSTETGLSARNIQMI